MTTTHAQMVDNILDMYDMSTDAEYREGMAWYFNANRLAWDLDILNPKRAAGVIAALSPLLSWDKNVEYARQVYAGKTDIPYLPNNVAKAILIRNGWNALDYLRGQKVVSFYHNICNPWSEDYVTIDKHAYDVAMNIENGPYRGLAVSKGAYIGIQRAYVEAADEMEITPSQMQAITWLVQRNVKRGK